MNLVKYSTDILCAVLQWWNVFHERFYFSQDSSSDDDSSDDEDDTAALMAELNKIKKERAQEAAKREQDKAAEEERIRIENITKGNPLLNKDGASDFKVKRRWDRILSFLFYSGTIDLFIALLHLLYLLHLIQLLLCIIEIVKVSHLKST